MATAKVGRSVPVRTRREAAFCIMVVVGLVETWCFGEECVKNVVLVKNVVFW